MVPIRHAHIISGKPRTCGVPAPLTSDSGYTSDAVHTHDAAKAASFDDDNELATVAARHAVALLCTSGFSMAEGEAASQEGAERR